MRGSAALHADGSEAAQKLSVVVLDIAGRRVDLDPGDAALLRNQAAAHAGSSSAARDLSLLLDRALCRGQVLALRRSEAQLLGRFAGDLGLAAVADEIAATPGTSASSRAPEHWSSSDATTLRA